MAANNGATWEYPIEGNTRVRRCIHCGHREGGPFTPAEFAAMTPAPKPREIPEELLQAREQHEAAVVAQEKKRAEWFKAISARSHDDGGKNPVMTSDRRFVDPHNDAVEEARAAFETAQGCAHELWLRMVKLDASGSMAAALVREAEAREAAEAEAGRLRRLRPPRSRPLGERVREALAGFGRGDE
jgi:Mg-chelatase subunit ChlD